MGELRFTHRVWHPLETAVDTSSRQCLHDEARITHILVRPRSRDYLRGEQIEREVRDISGTDSWQGSFVIEASLGSGFAGQVYRALSASEPPAGGELPGGSDARWVAIKVLRPKSRWKEIFRELLFRLSYQAPYTPRLREASLRSGLIWQELLRVAARVRFQADCVVPKPLGYFWDDELDSYVEIHEWVNGREAIYEADEHLLTRRIAGVPLTPGNEMNRKRAFMREMAALCHEIGAIGLARQYEWYTLVSQANVLTRNDHRIGQSEFVAVDCRPGLAVPFFLPLSPAHARIIWQGSQRGIFAHFDQVDFHRLETFIAAHPQDFAGLQTLIQRLKEDDTRYRSALPDVYHIRQWASSPNADRWHSVREAAIQDWRQLRLISDAETEKLRNSAGRLWLYLLCDWLPLAGRPALCLMGNERVRQHLRQMANNAAYRQAAFAALKTHDLRQWENAQRITPQHRAALDRSTAKYILEKLALSWTPGLVHRLATDREARQRLVQTLFVHPIRLCFDKTYRQDWLVSVIERQARRGVVTPQQVSRLQEQIREIRMQGYLRDFGLTIGLEIVSKAVYLSLAAYGLSTSDFWPLGIAALGPISPSGVVRGMYVLTQLILDTPHILQRRDSQLLLTRLLGALIAPWRYAGNAFALLEMFADYPEMSLLLADDYISRLVNLVPIFGGRGKLLEYWAFTLLYNLPLSIRKALLS